MKAWLQENIPALYVRYTTVMRYKAMAKRLRQVVGLADPVPAEAVLAEPPRGGGEAKRDYGTYEIKMVAADGAEAGCRVGRRVTDADEGWRRRRMEG